MTYIGSGAFSYVELADDHSKRDIYIGNANCTIASDKASSVPANDPYYTLGNPHTTVIHGYAGSTAETYAKAHEGFTFEPLA